MDDSPVVILFDAAGVEIAVSNGVAIPVGTKGYLAAGSDGTTARFLLVDANGRPIVVGAGVAGTPAGGVHSVQGVSGGTPMAITGSITASNASIGTVGSATVASATEIGASDGTNLQIPRVFDTDTGAGTQFTLGAVLRKSASGGSVEAGTATDPLRTDPTGTTAQPVTGTVAATQSGSWTNDVTDRVGRLVGIVYGSQGQQIRQTATNFNLQAELAVGGTLIDPRAIRALTNADVVSAQQSGSWTVTANIGTSGALALDATLTGGTQRTKITDGTTNAAVKAASTAAVAADPALVVAISPNNTVAITGTVTAPNPSVGSNNAAIPTSSTQVGGSDGTNLQAARVFDADTGAGTQYVLGTVLRKSASGGSVEAGTATDPLRTDPTGTTTQPVSGTVTANIGTSGALALDATLTGGTQRTKITDGTTNAAVKAASTAAVAADPAVVVAISPNNTVAVTQSGSWTNDVSDRAARLVGVVYGSQGQQIRQTATNFNLQAELAVGGTLIDPRSIRALTNADVVSAQQSGTWTVTQGTAAAATAPWAVRLSDGAAFYTAPSSTQLPAALVGARLDINNGAWLGSTAPTVGSKTSANSIPVVIASDQGAVPVSGTVTANIGTSGALALDATLTGGTQRTKITDGTTNAAVKAASTAAVAADPALVVAISPNNTLSVALAANQSVNLAQVGGTTTVTGGVAGSQGVGGLGASGAAVTGNPVLVGGSDGTNARTIATDSNGLAYEATLAQAIARSRVANGYAQSFFGEVTTAAAGAKTAINATPYVEQAAGAQRSFRSTSASDAAAGTGARTIRITYFTLTALVVAGPFTETLTLNGTTAVNTVATNICLVEELEVMTVGSTGSNVGTVNMYTATAGGGTIFASIAATDNLSKWAHHYVSSGRVCMIYDIFANNDAASGNNQRVSLEVLDLGTANAAEKQALAVRFDARSQAVLNPYTPTTVIGPARINAYITPQNATSQVTTIDVKYVEI